MRVAAERLDAIGLVMDFHELERVVDEFVRPMHNRHLNELPAFAEDEGGMNPSAENVALHVGRSVAHRLPRGVALASVEVWETPEDSAVYRP